MRFVAAVMVAAVAMALINLVILASTGYARVAERHLDTPHSPGAAAAADIAASLAPWSARHAALHGWLRVEAHDAAGAQAAYHNALFWSAADPLLWTEYALALARLGDFGPAFARAVATAGSLAPTSPNIQQALADLGLSYWTRGTPQVQQQWLDSMRFTLKHRRGAFLDGAVRRGQARAFCRGPARGLGEELWCETVASRITGCYVTTDRGPVPCGQGR